MSTDTFTHTNFFFYCYTNYYRKKILWNSCCKIYVRLVSFSFSATFSVYFNFGCHFCHFVIHLPYYNICIYRCPRKIFPSKGWRGRGSFVRNSSYFLIVFISRVCICIDAFIFRHAGGAHFFSWRRISLREWRSILMSSNWRLFSLFVMCGLYVNISRVMADASLHYVLFTFGSRKWDIFIVGNLSQVCFI